MGSLMRDTDVIRDENAVVWLIDPATTPYVREMVLESHYRKRPPNKNSFHCLAGYTTVGPKAKRHGDWGYYRRVFWLMPHDRALAPDDTYKTGAPTEAVDPLTVKPGVWGVCNDRAWGKA